MSSSLLTIGEIPYWENRLSDPLPIPRDYPIELLNCYLAVQGDTGAAPVNDPEAPISLIKRIEVRADGELLHIVDGESLSALTYFYRRTPTVKNIITTAAQSNVQLGYADIEVLFNGLGLFPDFSSYLLAPKYDDLTMQVLWGTDADLGVDYTVDSASLKVKYQPNYNINKPPWFIKHVTTISKEITASQRMLKFEFPTSGAWQFILLKEEIDGLPVSNIINTISVWLGGTAYKAKDIERSIWQAQVKYGLNLQQLIDGYTLIDLTDFSGNWESLFEVEALLDWGLELDVTKQAGVNFLKVTYCYFDPWLV